MQLSDLQRRMLSLLAEREDWVSTPDLLTALDASHEEFKDEARQLSERRLVMLAVASLGSGGWKITTRGRDCVEGGAE